MVLRKKFPCLARRSGRGTSCRESRQGAEESDSRGQDGGVSPSGTTRWRKRRGEPSRSRCVGPCETSATGAISSSSPRRASFVAGWQTATAAVSVLVSRSWWARSGPGGSGSSAELSWATQTCMSFPSRWSRQLTTRWSMSPHTLAA